MAKVPNRSLQDRLNNVAQAIALLEFAAGKKVTAAKRGIRYHGHKCEDRNKE